MTPRLSPHAMPLLGERSSAELQVGLPHYAKLPMTHVAHDADDACLLRDDHYTTTSQPR